MNSALSIIIVHYGKSEHTINCLKSLIQYNYNANIILVCNTIIKNLNEHIDISKLTIIEQSSNAGFAKACNIGIKHALSLSNTKYIWLLNNDTIINNNTVENLLNCLQNTQRSIVGTAVYCMDNEKQLELILGCKFYPYLSIYKECQSEHNIANIDYVYGASFAFPIDLIKQIGLLDEQFFLYYEEHDYCLRAKKAGYSFIWCKQAKVWHVGGQSAGLKHKDKINSARKFSHYHETRSTFLFLKKHYPLALPTAFLIRTLAKLILLPLRGQWQLLPSYFKGLFEVFCK